MTGTTRRPEPDKTESYGASYDMEGGGIYITDLEMDWIHGMRIGSRRHAGWEMWHSFVLCLISLAWDGVNEGTLPRSEGRRESTWLGWDTWEGIYG